ncbi:MAG: hypothetical protein IH585_04390 [Anaerolineaceae bacterium]|nr:hypothetical protein [Anaerolineaceae bacterium]
MKSSIVRAVVLCVGNIFLILVLSSCAKTSDGSEIGTDGTQASESEKIATPEQPPADIQFGQDGEPPRNPAVNTVMSIFVTDDFLGAGTCLLCHANLFDQGGVDVSITTDWRSTMMANASRDPIWQAKVSSEIERMPDLQAVIEVKCVTCHQPMAKTQAEVVGAAVAMFGDGFNNPAHALHLAGMDGVSCALCHQIQDKNLGGKESFTGGFKIDASTSPPNRPMFGPYETPFGFPMQNHTGFIPVYGEHTNQAELCATCHTLLTSYMDAEGNILGEFPEQTPYIEWENSQYGSGGIVCQNCHMPVAQGGVTISIMPGNLQPREPFFKHYFVGGNAFVLTMLSDWGGDMGIGADKAHFDATIARVKEQIGQRSASLTAKSLEVRDGQLIAQLQITPFTGHKFPTGFPSRRAWLHVTVTDAAGILIFESGKINLDGSINGNASDMDPASYEPHYDLITSPDQVQIYEPIMINSDGEVTYTLMRAATYVKDNRLLPNGTEKTTLPEDVAVHGAALQDPNFMGGGDLITYQIDVSDAQGPFTFSAELLYEPLSYRFIQDMFTDETAEIEQFSGYYGETYKQPLLVAAIEPVEVK